MSSGGGTKTEYTISPEQRKALKAVLSWAEPALEKRAPAQPYSGRLVAKTPELFQKSYDRYLNTGFSSIIDDATRDLIRGVPAYKFDAGQAARQWSNTYAQPVMNAWKENILPTIKESMNMPGSLYSRGTSDYIAKQASNFYGSQVAPQLYDWLKTGEQMGAQSLENAYARRASATALPYQKALEGMGISGALQQQEQARLTARYKEFLRTDPFEYAKLLGGIGTSSTRDVVGMQGTDWAGSLISGGSQLGSAMIIASAL